MESSQIQYTQQLEATVRLCQGKLEKRELLRVQDIQGAEDVRERITKLKDEWHAALSVKEALSVSDLFIPVFKKFEAFLKGHVGAAIDTSFGWGLFYMSIEISAQEEHAITRLSRMLKSIGHKMELFNAYCENDIKLDQLKQAALDVYTELLAFCANTIKFLHSSEVFERVSEASWHQFTKDYDTACTSIDDALQRVEKLARLATHIDEVHRLQVLLSLTPGNFSDEARLPCIVLPAARNARFYDRDHIIDKIHAHLHDDPTIERFRSLALHGLGGVGKTHVALKYAHTKAAEFRAILWIRSQTAASLEQSFTDVALRLKLPGADARKHEENRIEVLDWLQNTQCKWLLVYDNAENADLLLKYWPVSNRGCALITARDHSLAYELVETDIEILPFDPETGSHFVLHLLQMDIAADTSSAPLISATQLSEKLSGHALAISQMAGLILKRSWTIEEFLTIYDRNTKRMLGMPGKNSLDAVWKLSFESLTPASAAILGVLTYMTPDSIPQALFEPFDPNNLPVSLTFCSDEFEFSEVLGELLTLALIKRDKSSRQLSLHRLVQAKYKYHLSMTDRQRAFDDATKLLYDAFPQPDAIKGQLYDRWTQCQLYSQHLLSLKDNYTEAANSSEPLKPTFMFCKLLKAFSRFLLESASYAAVQDVLAVAREVFDALEPELQDQDVSADIYAATGLMWAHRGFFARSEPFQRQALALRLARETVDLLELSWTQVNLANVTASTQHYEESLDYQLEALRNRQISGGDDMVVMKPQGVLYQNLGRSMWLVGRYKEAHIWCHMGISVLSESKNWAMLAYTHFVLGNLCRTEGNLEDARKSYSDAQKVWLERGQMKTHHFNGACTYKLGCVALDSGDKETAVTLLREAYTVAQLHQKVLAGDYARAAYKLGSVLEGVPDTEEEATAKKGEAKAILKDMNKEIPPDETEKTYDSLVYILWR